MRSESADHYFIFSFSLTTTEMLGGPLGRRGSAMIMLKHIIHFSLHYLVLFIEKFPGFFTSKGYDNVTAPLL